MTKIIYTGSNRDVWLGLRRKGIGASDVPILMGCSKFKSPMKLAAEKMGLVDGEQAGGPAKRGHDLENMILDKLQNDGDFQKKFPNGLVFPDQRLAMSSELDFMLATQDGFAETTSGKFLVEVKSPNFMYDGDERTQPGVPYSIWVQCQSQLYVAEQDLLILVVLPAVTWELQWTIIERNERFIREQMLPACKHFWSLVESMTPPAAIGMDDELKAIAAIHHRRTTDPKQLHADFVEMCEELDRLVARNKSDEREIKRIKNTIINALEGSDVGILPNGQRITYKADKNGRRTLRRK